MNPGEDNRIRELCKLLYYHIFGHFMNAYDNLHFENPANFSTKDYDIDDNENIIKYVKYFFNREPTRCDRKN